jgi:hypothetical protein
MSSKPLNNPYDLFLISGQSNAIGHTNARESLTRGDEYWSDLMHLFKQDLNQSQWNQELYKLIDSVHVYENGPPEVIANLRDEVIKLWQFGLLNSIDEPLSSGK